MQQRVSPSDSLQRLLDRPHSWNQISWVHFSQFSWEKLKNVLRSVSCPVLNQPWSVERFIHLPGFKLQHVLSRALHNAAFCALLESASPSHQARLRSASGPGSASFLTALPYLQGCS